MRWELRLRGQILKLGVARKLRQRSGGRQHLCMRSLERVLWLQGMLLQSGLLTRLLHMLKGCETTLLIKHLGLHITRDDEDFHGAHCRRKGSSYWRPRHFCSRSPAAAQKLQTINYCSGIKGPQEALPTRGE